ncbi:DHH family phosphoesterase [Helicobacter anatolicus]|uniref:DHH family phosphoesterase n=1 Tax=Helicobacter anatolicus TaxID=2905874 RepID=UPI001E2D9C95|nr:DHHA1 domain-containing protein [Helicobacter anatolicus]MCE3036771.1 3',5'-cyclic-nucleotide phosphodiesterase [Helicobacter anatolicus]MCE3039165.1 3',5'-cyclic-nucleotide phosphodiesterase [Helicobacter anatolicus]
MQVFHLSHIDLDGYGCQFIAKNFFDHIQFYNANYGKEVLARLQTIVQQIQNQVKLESKFRSKKPQKFLILITDLNLSMQESLFLQEKVDFMRIDGIDIEIILLDHHISGEESAKNFGWYFLDTQRCATKITYHYLKEHYTLKNPQDEKILDLIVEMINSIDIWKEENYGFEFGKVALSLIANSNELNRFMFDEEHRNYKFKLLESIKDYITLPNAEVAFDNAIFRLKKIALGGNPETQTMDNITSMAQVKLLTEKKDTCTINYKDKKGFLSYSMGGISVLANLFLKNNPEYDFYIDINAKGNVSLRANGNCDVNTLSKECFNGGGHKNASGGKLEHFRESFVYEDIKNQVIKALTKEKE